MSSYLILITLHTTAEIAILHSDNEISPNAVINYFPQTSLSLTCLGVEGHRSLTWETQDGGPIPHNTASSSSVYQTYYVSGAQILSLNLTSSDVVGDYLCRSQQSNFGTTVTIALEDPFWRIPSPSLSYLPVGGEFTFITMQYADNSTGYQNFGAGFLYFVIFIHGNNTQAEIILESGLTSDFAGNEYNYGAITRISEQDGTYRINGWVD